MDFVNSLTSGDKKAEEQQKQQKQDSSGGLLGTLNSIASGGKGSGKQGSDGGLMGKLNSMAGGGKESEKQEDGLDKGKQIRSCSRSLFVALPKTIPTLPLMGS